MRKSVWAIIASANQAEVADIPTQFNGVASTDPVAGWGFIKRNKLYTGYACEIEDVDNPGTYTDISFDSDGLVTAALPYTNNRINKLYDQWGDDHMVWDPTTSSEYMEPFVAGTDTGGVRSRTMFMEHNDPQEFRDGGLISTKNALAANWSVSYPTLLSSFVRTGSQWRGAIMGVRTVSGTSDWRWGNIIQHLYELGVVLNGGFNIASGAYQDWNNGRLYKAIHDFSSTGHETYVNDDWLTYSNGSTTSYTYHNLETFRMSSIWVNYGQFRGAIFEGHIWSNSTLMSATEITDLTDLMHQAETFDRLQLDYENGTHGLKDATDDSEYDSTLTWVGGAFVDNSVVKEGSLALNVNAGGGTNDYVTIPNIDFGDDQDFTIETYFRSTAHNGTWWHSAIGNFNSSSTGSWSVFCQNNPNNYMAWAVDGESALVGTTDILEDVWYHVAVVRQNGTVRLYVDGVQENSVAQAVTVKGSAAVSIGGNDAGVNDRWVGYLDMTRIIRGECLYPDGTTFTPPTSF